MVHDKSGLWVFGKSGESKTVLPSTATVKPDGLVEFQDYILAVKQQGAFDPSTVWKASKLQTASSGAHNGATSPSSLMESSIRNAQAVHANAKVSSSIAAVDIKKENGAESSPVKSELTVYEPVFEARDIQEHFIAAVLATLSYHLCHDGGFVALNARTLVLPASEYLKTREDCSQTAGCALSQEKIWLVTLDVHLTSLGTLVLKAWPGAPFDFSWSLSPRQDLCLPSSLTDGTTLFLAPSGKVARYCGPAILDVPETLIDASNPSVEQYDNESLLRGESMKRWKARCLSWLGNKGIRIDSIESSGWLIVQIRWETNSIGSMDAGDDVLWTPEAKLVTIAWPALLCFKRKPSAMVQHPDSGPSRSHDPLTFAEGWFSSRVSREATVVKRQKERESAAAAVQAQAEAEARNIALNNFSPAGLRRASIAGAVYPTPPDGIQPTIGATPSFDGNGSTPGPPNTQTMAIDSENPVLPKSEPEFADGNLWYPNEVKRDQISSTLDFNDNDNDNLFGDMGGDLFGETDITDADFSFFDEPDPAENAEDSAANEENSIEDTSLAADQHRAVDTASSSKEADVVMSGTDFEKTPGVQTGKPAGDQVFLLGVNANAEIALSESQTQVSIRRPPSPPLSPNSIFKRLSAAGHTSSSTRKLNTPNRTVSSFGGVAFDPLLSSFNEKYGPHGHFTYPSIHKSFDQHVSKHLPKTGYLSKISKRRSTKVNLLNQAFILHGDAFVPEQVNHNSPSTMESPSYSHDTSIPSDQDDTSDSNGDSPLVVSPNLKRKRGPEDTEDGDDDFTSSFQDMKVDQTQFLQTPDLFDLVDHNLIDADPADWSLASFLSCPEPRNVTSSLSDPDYVASAQVLADQAISRTLYIPLVTDNSTVRYIENGVDGQGVKNLIQQKLAEAVKSCFDRAIACTMATFIDIQDLQPAGQINRLPPRPTPRGPTASESVRPNSIFSLPAPHIEVQRSESKLTVLPPAVPFWENLGLAPCKGGKDISAICIYPSGGCIADSVDAFLDQVRNAYESSRLGSHERFSHGDLIKGHVPMDFGDSATLSVADHQAVLMRIKETANRVAASLAAGPISENNIVIYCIYDSESPELLVPICSAFHDLFEVYRRTLDEDKLPVSNELVFQLVPLNFIASKASLVIPPPSEYTRLAMEVYDRCVDLNTGTSVPSIILEQPSARAIDFKLTPNPSASPLQENSCIHVAYAQSLDNRWITAAWTDNTGSQQMTASYCLGRRNAPLTMPFSDVAREIWETTLGIIAIQKVNWRVMISKSGIMDPSEVEVWKALAATESSAQTALTLITVNTNPSLELLPPSISVAPNVLAAQSSVYTTPVSTPQASIFSPEPGNASTPAKDAGPANPPTPNDSNAELKIDAEATLVDIADQTWGAILSHHLNNSCSLLEFNPALISGYLIKRSGASPSDVPIVLEVNIVHSEVFPRMYDPLLREVLGIYRGLATLARVRGCVDPVKDGRPWHIAAAEKGVKALYMLM